MPTLFSLYEKAHEGPFLHGLFGSKYILKRKDNVEFATREGELCGDSAVLKEITLKNGRNENLWLTNNMRKLRHKNLVTVYDCDMKADQLLILMERREDGTLTDLIKVRKLLCLGEVAHLHRQAYKGLAYLHGGGIVHRNLVPSNIFIWARGELRDGQWEAVNVLNILVKLGEVDSSHFIADRDVSKKIKLNTVSKQDYFCSPEVKRTIRDENVETAYSFASDVAALARCALALLTKEMVPLEQDVRASLPGLENTIFANDFFLPQLDQDPARRPTAQELLNNCAFLNSDYGRYNAEAYRHYIKATDTQIASVANGTTGYGSMVSTISETQGTLKRRHESGRIMGRDAGGGSGMTPAKTTRTLEKAFVTQQDMDNLALKFKGLAIRTQNFK